MVLKLYLDPGECLDPENLGNEDGDSSVPPSSEDHAAPQRPAVKKERRRWAAWTRSEEESFFSALRQVGKNFEKITCHVPSKNKDQVRHYYYRLVRRMNKILSPELCLNAKNSEDTIAAMLRWWSLLEKISCKASKLHLKPRRFKMFIDSLENQLLKDRKKSIRKQLIAAENISSMAQCPVSNQVKASTKDNHVGRQNIRKVGSGKRSLIKHRISTGTNHNYSEVVPTTTKAAKRRRKSDKRLETEAIAGVLLVADAAEYLERGCINKEIEHAQDAQETPGHECSQPVGGGMQSLPKSPQKTSNNQSSRNSGKLKLQLFPIDEGTQKALEMDNHNPHLELTLSTWKKISSVLEHLNRKWGNLSLLSQDLMLFPYWAQRENLLGYQHWTKDSPLCAADVYNLIRSPPIFRLRYGWFSKAEVESATTQPIICNDLHEKNLSPRIDEELNVETEYTIGPCDERNVSTELITTLTPPFECTPINIVESGASVSNFNIAQYPDGPAAVSSLGTQHGDLAFTDHFEQTDTTFSAGNWADSTTTTSVEDLLSESMRENDINFSQFPDPVASDPLQQTPLSCDSFDAEIAAFIHKHENQANLERSVASPGPPLPIWDAEETCDAFMFQRNNEICDKDYSSSVPCPFPSQKEVEELLQEDTLENKTPRGDTMDDHSP